jgi:DNA-binding response OmpR family regulator
VPSRYQTSARARSPGSILLLEEYDALAAAISSALKKFAPDHKVSRARSLAEAEQLATKIEPELFIIDVDLPWLGITNFLERLRTANPSARALVLGAAIPDEISAERGSFGALQFIGKPFELAEFGAAVQAVLGPWRKSASASPRGSLEKLNTLDVLLLHCAAEADVIVDIESAGRSGKIQLSDGQISHAETGNLRGADALREMLAWSDARLSETKAVGALQRSVDRDWISIVVELLRQTPKPTASLISPAEEAPPPPPPPRPKAGKKVVVIDDTEMLLIFVEDVLATADPELQITTAITGAEGIEKVEQILPDLVLLDYSLPDLNGDEVCRRLLENERTARVPVLMMSGHVAEMNATAERFENVVATIEKPFLSDALVQLVQRVLAVGTTERRTIAKKVAAPAAAKALPPMVPPAFVPPPVQERKPEPPKAEPRAPTPLPPVIFKEVPPTPSTPPIVRLAGGQPNVAVLGLFLDVISMQLTPELQMGAIRAKPASSIVSLRFSSAAAREAVPAQTGFQLGPIEIDSNRRISVLRLLPTAAPLRPTQTRSAFEIGGVTLIPNNARARVQLTPSGTTPMTIELLAELELGAVELSNTFQVAQLILKWRTNTVRVTLNPKAPGKTGAAFEPTEIKLDRSGRIAELLLKPAT